MRKIIQSILLLTMIVSVSACSNNVNTNSSLPETNTPTENEVVNEGNYQKQEEKNSNENVTTDKEIVFRDIPWYSTKMETEKILSNSGITTHQYRSNDIYRISGINYAHTTYSTDLVKGGGYISWYPDIDVAGYKADDMNICYMYPLRNGDIVKSDNESQMYFAYYTFSTEYIDHAAIYDDLKNKLSSLYGIANEETNGHLNYTTWQDAKANQIRIVTNAEKTYVTLGYMAGEAEKKLDEIQKVLDKIALSEEEKSRETNKSNMSGL